MLLHCYYGLWLAFWPEAMMLNFSKSVAMKKTNSSTSWMAWGWVIFSILIRLQLEQPTMQCFSDWNPFHIHFTFVIFFWLKQDFRPDFIQQELIRKWKLSIWWNTLTKKFIQKPKIEKQSWLLHRPKMLIHFL